MTQMVLIANHSVEEEIVGVLKHNIDDFNYMLFPASHGKLKNAIRLETPAWQDENFLLISSVNDHKAGMAESLINEIKSRFPEKEIKLFLKVIAS